MPTENISIVQPHPVYLGSAQAWAGRLSARKVRPAAQPFIGGNRSTWLTSSGSPFGMIIATGFYLMAFVLFGRDLYSRVKVRSSARSRFTIVRYVILTRSILN